MKKIARSGKTYLKKNHKKYIPNMSLHTSRRTAATVDGTKKNHFAEK